MLSVSSAYKTAIADHPANVKTRIVFTLASNETLTITDDNIWQGGLTVEDAVSSDGIFELGSTHVGQMTVSLIDLDGTLLNTDFDGAEAVLYLATEGQSYVQKGIYNVVKCDYSDSTINITAYDRMNKFSVSYSESTLTYPATYLQIVQDACTACGVALNTSSASFDGNATTVSTKPTDATLTFREVIGYVAQACGYNLRCSYDGKLTFVRYNMSGFASGHSITSIYGFEHSHYPITITGVKIVVTSEVSTTDADGEITTENVTTEYTSGTDDYQLVIQDNPFITNSNAQTFADLIYSTFGSVTFYSGHVSHSSDFTIEASDVGRVTDRRGNNYNFLISRTVFSTGAAQSTYSCAEDPASRIAVQPTGLDKLNTSVKQALLDAKNSQNKANYAYSIAGNTSQYFWHTETGTDTGAHITEIPKDDFLDDPTNGGGNLLARSNGIAVRDGLTELATFSANGIAIGDASDPQISIDSGGDASFKGTIYALAGHIGSETDGFEINNKSNVANYYPTISGNSITSTGGSITQDSSTKIVTLSADGTVTYVFPVTSNTYTIEGIYYSGYYDFTEGSETSITATVQYLDSSSTVLGTSTFQSSYQTSGLWYFGLDTSLVAQASTIRMTFALISGATVIAYSSYGSAYSISCNADSLFDISDTSRNSVYISVDGISVNDSVGLLPNGTVKAKNIEISGNSIEMTESNKERRLLITNTAYDNGQTYGVDGVFPHACYLYGGRSSSQIAFGLWDVANNSAVWRYNDYADALYVHKYLSCNNSVYASGNITTGGNILPSSDNTSDIGTANKAFGYGHIRALKIGLGDYSESSGSVFSYWADGNTHDILARNADGLNLAIGWIGTSTYQTTTTIRGQDVKFYTDKGTVSVDDMYKGSGDTWSCVVYTAGFVTSSRTSVRFVVPIPYVSGTLSVTSMTSVYIRTISGTYAVSGGTVSASNITCTKYDGFARIVITYSSALDVTNNTPVGIEGTINFRVS